MDFGCKLFVFALKSVNLLPVGYIGSMCISNPTMDKFVLVLGLPYLLIMLLSKPFHIGLLHQNPESKSRTCNSHRKLRK